MKISYNWLCCYLNGSPSPEEMDTVLTNTGLEVDSIEKVESVKGGLHGVVAAEVLTCIDHPNSDHLHLTTLNIGNGGEPLKVVCGAPNVAAGQKVFVATIGTKLYFGEDEVTIKKGKIRGEESWGMICSESELGISNNHDGIMVLPADTKIGTSARDYLNMSDDYVIEIGLTPNRTDAVSHIGVARDLVAGVVTEALVKGEKSDLQYSYPDISLFDTICNGKKPIVDIDVVDAKGAPRYAGLTISGVEVKESPEWLKKALMVIGIRSINNIVDVTNYVLHELGQPLHAFDADKIAGGKVVVRRAVEGVKFITLDGVERTLSNDDLMICNVEREMCLAGVFGGAESGVSSATKNIFLESAYFDAVSIRKSSRRHGLQTDASFRYERGADVNIVEYAAKRAALLLKEVAGGEISMINDVYPSKIENCKVELNYNSVFSLIGKEIGVEMIKTILNLLDFKIENETDNGLLTIVPSYRVDVTRECDVIEEILRIYGYNNIEIGTSLKSSLSYSAKPDKVAIENMIANMLSANSFYEIMNNSLTASSHTATVEEFCSDENVVILNSLSSELDVMRRTLLFGGLQSISYNVNRKNNNLKLYEFGRVYTKNINASGSVTDRYSENKRLGLWTIGDKELESWKKNSDKADSYYLNSMLQKIFKRIGLDVDRIKYEEVKRSYFSGAIALIFKKKTLAEFGIVAPKLLKSFDIKQPIFFADVDWGILMSLVGNGVATYTEISKYPDVRRDLALLIDKNVTFDTLAKLARQTETQLLKSINLFDIYEGDKIEQGKKSYAMSFILQSKDKTLTDDVIDKSMDRLIKAFTDKLGAKLR